MLLLPVGVKVNKWQKIDIYLFPLSHCTKLVPFNTKLDSTLGLPRLTKFIRDCTYINSYFLSVFIGILLGDANFNGRRGSHNIRISFKQSINNFPYLWLVFSNL